MGERVNALQPFRLADFLHCLDQSGDRGARYQKSAVNTDMPRPFKTATRPKEKRPTGMTRAAHERTLMRKLHHWKDHPDHPDAVQARRELRILNMERFQEALTTLSNTSI